MNAFLQAHIGVRRAIVIAMYGSYVVGAIAQWRVHEIVRQPDQVIILVLFLISLALGLLLFAGTHYGRWGTARSRLLDEREIAARNAIYVLAYRWIATISLVGCVAWQIGLQPHHPLSVDSNVLVWGYVLLLTTLPTALLACMEQPVMEGADEVANGSLHGGAGVAKT